MITAKDVEVIYEVPLIFNKEGLGNIIVEKLGLPQKEVDLAPWTQVVSSMKEPRGEIKIAIVGKYANLRDSYKSLVEALHHGGAYHGLRVDIQWVDAEEVEREGPSLLRGSDGMIVPGGFGSRGIEGKIKAISYARREKIPFLGICLGMQCAVVEFARNVCGLDRAASTEFDLTTPHPVIHLSPEQAGVVNKGGTMRLGAYPCLLRKDTNSHESYGVDEIVERHRHRYEVNNDYRELLKEKGMIVAGVYPNRDLVEIVEIKDHPWFVGVQFHPEFKSKPLKPHPLFRKLVEKSWEKRDGEKG